MADPDFPLTMRTPLISGYSLEPTDTVTRTQFDYGVSRSRKRFERANTLTSAGFRFNENEFTVFVNWYETTITDGALWFNINLDTGSGTSEITRSKFTEKYTASKNGKLWDVTCRLELEQTKPQQTPLTQEEIDAFQLYAPRDFAIFESLFNNSINNLSAFWYL